MNREEIIREFLENRITLYNGSIRSRYVQFREKMHDIIRKGEAMKLTSPVSVFWAITDKCNLSCKHCYASDYHTYDNVELNSHECKKIIDKISEFNCLDLTFEGGEPFLRKDFLEIVSYAKSKNLIVDIITNATLISEEKVQLLEQILNQDTDGIQVSLDGYRACNDSIRGKGVYDIVIDKLSLMQNIPNIVVNCVATGDLFKNIKNLCNDLIAKTNVKILHISPLMKLGNGKNLDDVSIYESIEKFMHIKKLYHGKLVISGTPIDDRFWLINKQKIDLNKNYSKAILGCCAGRSKLYLDSFGNAYPCTFLRTEKYKGANIQDKSSFEIWDSMNQDIINEAYEDSICMNANKVFNEFCIARKGISYE